MKLSKLGIAVMVCSLLVAPVSFAVQPIYNVEHHEIHAVESLTLKQIRARIMNAAAERRWSCKDAGKNSLTCGIDVRGRHQAKVEIQYDQTSFSIHNVSSKNLNYKNGKIHRNYNKWIKILESTIVKALNAT